MPATTLKNAGYRERLRAELAGLDALRAEIKVLSAKIAEVREQEKRGETYIGAAKPLERQWGELQRQFQRIANENEMELLNGCPDRSLIVKRRRLQEEKRQLAQSANSAQSVLRSERERLQYQQSELEAHRAKKTKPEPSYVSMMEADIAAGKEFVDDARLVVDRVTKRQLEIESELRDIRKAMIAC